MSVNLPVILQKIKTYFVGLEFPESNIDGDTTFTFGLEFVQNPGVFEGTFTHFLGFLLELFDSSLVDTTALVDQVTGSGRFTGIDVTDNDDVDVSLFFSHSEKFSILIIKVIISPS